jgi:hypothetical protein
LFSCPGGPLTQIRYVGVTNPKAVFDELRPYRRARIKMKAGCRPFGPEYLILTAAQEALDTACFHFTRDPTFYVAPPHG